MDANVGPNEAKDNKATLRYVMNGTLRYVMKRGRDIGRAEELPADQNAVTLLTVA